MVVVSFPRGQTLSTIGLQSYDWRNQSNQQILWYKTYSEGGDKMHTLNGVRNLSESSDSAKASPFRATSSAFIPILSKSSWWPFQIIQQENILQTSSQDKQKGCLKS